MQSMYYNKKMSPLKVQCLTIFIFIQGSGGAGEFFVQRTRFHRQQQRAVFDDWRLVPSIAQSPRCVRLFLNGKVRHTSPIFDYCEQFALPLVTLPD
jgi:hypothetical protein